MVLKAERRSDGNLPSASSGAPDSAGDVEARLFAISDPRFARFQQRFFQTGPGGYGEGDVFLGIKVPAVRAIARDFRVLPLTECEKLLASPNHEARLAALFILVDRFKRSDSGEQEAIFRLYLSRTNRINSWDLVDSSAAKIVGGYLLDRERSILLELAHSGSVWERRIAIIATQPLIRSGQFADTLKVADILLADRHELIHKAVGWTLREVGKRDRAIEESFLQSRYHRMPRTMLRYAIEKFPEDRRRQYLRGEV